VCWNNLEAIAEGLELPNLVDAIEALRLQAPGDDPSQSQGDNDVAAHYDEMQARRWEGAADALDPRIHNLRRLNNWIKTVVIETAREGGGGGSGGGGGEAAGTVDDDDDDDPVVGQRPNPLATVEQREAAAAAAAPTAASGGRRRDHPASSSSLRVLDLACGRGGDFKKWLLMGAEVYVGVDVSPQSVLECRARVEESRRRTGRPKVALVLTRSMLDEDLPDAVARALAAAAGEGKGQGEGVPPVFDVISIQFALHYGCGSEAALATLLRNVDRLLAPEGGTLLATSIDARCLRHHLLQQLQQQEQQGGAAAEFGNAVYRVQLSPEAAAAGPELGALGLRYTFSLSSAVEACDEYVVHLPSLRRLAHEMAGLRLARHVNFGRLVHDCLPRFGHLLEPLQVGQVSPAEWEAIQLYSSLVFQR
jgi:mRNA (guanine-N7-)-methyltransferase